MVFITTLVNLIGLAFSLWLGFYILTRSSRSYISWLAALTLWLLSSFFLHNSLAVQLPNLNAISWMRYTVVLALPLWLHLSLNVIPRQAQLPQHSASIRFLRLTIIVSYALAIFLIGLGIIAPPFFLIASPIPRLFLSDPSVGLLYPLVALYIFVVITGAMIALIYARRQTVSATLQQQFTIFLLATALAGSGALYIVVGTDLRLDLPIFPGDALLAIGVTLLGYAVAKYNAMIEGRRVERDFLYTLLAVGSLTALYLLIAVILYLGQQISFLTLILVMVGSLSFNALYDGIRVALDRLFYHGQFVEARANLRAFAREAGTGQRLNEQLQTILASLCRALRIQKGFVALSDEGDYVVAASLDANLVGKRFSKQSLSASEIIGLVRPERKGLDGMELLVPLFGGTSQIGAIVLGAKETGDSYTEQELEFLDDLAELARLIHAKQTQETNIQAINAMVAQYRERERALQLQLEQILSDKTRAPERDENEFVQQVEDALRHLHDISYLSDHPLSHLRAVELQMLAQKESSALTARGRSLYQVLLGALEQIRPDGVEPDSKEIAPRGWHAYIILHDSYVEDEPNRNIMSRLYIGEGTFNRTRRRALRNVARVLQEIESQAKPTAIENE